MSDKELLDKYFQILKKGLELKRYFEKHNRRRIQKEFQKFPVVDEYQNVKYSIYTEHELVSVLNSKNFTFAINILLDYPKFSIFINNIEFTDKYPFESPTMKNSNIDIIDTDIAYTVNLNGRNEILKYFEYELKDDKSDFCSFYLDSMPHWSPATRLVSYSIIYNTSIINLFKKKYYNDIAFNICCMIDNKSKRHITGISKQIISYIIDFKKIK
jgi:hypothetical protein